MKWKKDNKLPNTKNVRKKNPDGSLVNPPPPKKSKRSQNKKQSNTAVSNEVSVRTFYFKFCIIIKPSLQCMFKISINLCFSFPLQTNIIQCMRSDSLESMGEQQHYISASDVTGLINSSVDSSLNGQHQSSTLHTQQQQQQHVVQQNDNNSNKHSTNNNDNSNNLMNLHSNQPNMNLNTINIKSDYGLTTL